MNVERVLVYDGNDDDPTADQQFIHTRKYRVMRRLLNMTGLCFRQDTNAPKFAQTLRTVTASIVLVVGKC